MFKGGQMFHILAYTPHDRQPWKSRIDWMKTSPEGGFASRKRMYGGGNIIGLLDPTILKGALEPGKDILVVLMDEFGYTSKTTFEGAVIIDKDPPPQKFRTEVAKRQNPFSSSPNASPLKRLKNPLLNRKTDKTCTGGSSDKAISLDSQLSHEVTDFEMGAIWCQVSVRLSTILIYGRILSVELIQTWRSNRARARELGYVHTKRRI
ncbi:hypothetical protein EDB80DRAFT_684658 [Ilyonectria destructans]|nr:hypothetical protein EDB80DRAFT_684658 [Ilyonectria destructans]